MDAFLENLMVLYGEHRLAIWITGGVIMTWMVWRRLWRLLKQSAVPIFQSEFGHVAASVSAIREVVRGTCEYISPHSRPRIRVRVRKNNVRVRIRLKAVAGENVQQLSQKIQHLTALNLQEQFGFEAVGGIDIIITGFRGKGGSWQRPIPLQQHEKPSPIEEQGTSQP